MKKAVFTLIITFIIGVVFIAVGNDLLNGFPELGTVAAVAVMGGLTVYFNEQNKK